jgi:hypothetical protein
MDHIKTPYISYMRDAAGNLYRGGWVQTDGPPLPFEHAWSSSRYDPDEDAAIIDIGEQRTERVVKPTITTVPTRLCKTCYIGDLDWIQSGDFPSDATPVAIAADGWPTNCEAGKMGVQSVGLAADPTFVVSGSPVTSRGTISLDWADVPDGNILGRPPGAGDGDPYFFPLPAAPAAIVVAATSPLSSAYDGINTYTVALTGTIPAAQLGSGYPFSDLTGSASSTQLPTLDTIAGSTGKLSASNLGSGYPFSDLSGSATPGQLPTLDTIAGSSGKLSASNLGSGYPFADMSGSATPGQLPTLDTIAASSGPLSAANVGTGYPSGDLGSGALPSGVSVPAPQVTTGALPSGVTIPYAQVTGAPNAPTVASGTTLLYSSFTVSGTTATLTTSVSVPANSALIALWAVCTAAFTSSGSPPTSASLTLNSVILINGIGTNAPSTTIRTSGPASGSTTTSFPVVCTLTSSGSIGTLSAGSIKIWAMIVALP